MDNPPAGVSYPLQLASVSENHRALYEESLKNPEHFWGQLARKRLRWEKEFDQVMDCDMQKGDFKWFLGGVLNVSVNCLDRHAEVDPDRPALIWEKDEPGQHETVTYGQLLDMTCRIANVLKSQEVKKGDRVALYMPATPMLVASMMACARIGAIHSVVFAGFSAESLRNRILDGGCSVVITSNEGVRGGKSIPLKALVDQAVQGCGCVRRVLVSMRTQTQVPMGEKDALLEEAMSRESTFCPPEPMDSEDMLFMLYTSGSTGKPKGVVHTQAGYLLYASLTHEIVFDIRPGDIFACVADIGWITGHSYVVYGPLCNGSTSLLFESTPVYPDPGRYWEMVQRLKITHFYTAPTAVRMLIKAGDQWVKKYDRSSIRILGCVGEPLNEAAWQWYYKVVGEERCTIVDTYWQTETGGIVISPRPSADNSTPKPSYPSQPLYGIDPLLIDPANGQELVDNCVSGHLCIRKPWPSMARTIYGDHEAFLNTYYRHFPGYYFSGDGAYRDGDGDYRITGRVDDTINCKGHRVGTAELESAMNLDPRVAETAVVGYPHELYGQGIYAFVIPKDGVSDSDEAVKEGLLELVKSKIAAFAVPNEILIVPGLPKTRSGKIMRRILKKIASSQEEELGDVTTLADPSVVQGIVQRHKKQQED